MKLHLGCGNKYIPNFIHIDIVNYKHIDHITSIDNLSIFSDNSVDLIYNCHVLEHFKRTYTKTVLKEWYRILKPNGILRTSVPDFKQLCKIYEKYDNINYVIGSLFGRQDYLYNIHYNVFDFNSLSLMLYEIGFKSVWEYDWRETEHYNVDDYSQAYIPHMDKENGIQVSLNIEAIK